eukprot:jgi/Botrbrau1/5859/Bobra.0366s0040.1
MILAPARTSTFQSGAFITRRHASIVTIFNVSNFCCRLLVYPAGDTQAVKGYVSIYLQVDKPGTHKWDVFASYKLSIINTNDQKSSSRDSWHRFTSKKKSHGWADFISLASVLQERSGFVNDGRITIRAECLVLKEESDFTPESPSDTRSQQQTVSTNKEVLAGRFSWKVHNFGMFLDMIKSQKIMSPAWTAGPLSLRLSVYQSTVNNENFLSMCLESKDSDKSQNSERTCWTLFKMSVHSTLPGKSKGRDSYGRFAAKADKTGENTSLGWNDFMQMSDFLEPENGYLHDGFASFSASFHIIKEQYTFRSGPEQRPVRGRSGKSKGQGPEFYQGKFTWKISDFKRDLKDQLKKKKITGLCVKSKRFQVGSRDCRLIVYPRGQSQPPQHLSMFLEVTDPRSSGEWSCFVSHRLSVVNQKFEERTVVKESQNRYSRQAKDWGWREFITLTTLFDNDAGFILNDTIQFAAEVTVLKEQTDVREADLNEPIVGFVEDMHPQPEEPYVGKEFVRAYALSKTKFTWKIENFSTFCEILQTRKIFSKFFTVNSCDLRVGMYESFHQLCVYLESDNTTPDRNFQVDYRIAVMNQRRPDQTHWKTYRLYTRAWNNSVLQLGKMTDIVSPDMGHVVRDSLTLVVEVLDCRACSADYGDPTHYEEHSDDEEGSVTDDGDTGSEGSDFHHGLESEEKNQLQALLNSLAPAFAQLPGPLVGGPGPPMGRGAGGAPGNGAWAPETASDPSASTKAIMQSLRDFLTDPSKIAEVLRPAGPTTPSLLDMLISIPGFQVPVRIVVLEALHSLLTTPVSTPPVPLAGDQPVFSSTVGGPQPTYQGAMGREHPPPRPHSSTRQRPSVQTGMHMQEPRVLTGPRDREDDAECVSSTVPGDLATNPEASGGSFVRGPVRHKKPPKTPPLADLDRASPQADLDAVPPDPDSGLPTEGEQDASDEDSLSPVSGEDDGSGRPVSGEDASDLGTQSVYEEEEEEEEDLGEAEEDEGHGEDFGSEEGQDDEEDSIGSGPSAATESQFWQNVPADLLPSQQSYDPQQRRIGEDPSIDVGGSGPLYLPLFPMVDPPGGGPIPVSSMMGLPQTWGPVAAGQDYGSLSPAGAAHMYSPADLQAFANMPLTHLNKQLIFMLLTWISNHSGHLDANFLGLGGGEVLANYPMVDLVNKLMRALPPENARAIAAMAPHIVLDADKPELAHALLSFMHLRVNFGQTPAEGLLYGDILNALAGMIEVPGVAQATLQHLPQMMTGMQSNFSLALRLLLKIWEVDPDLGSDNMRTARRAVSILGSSAQAVGDFQDLLRNVSYASEFCNDIMKSIEDFQCGGEPAPEISEVDLEALLFLLSGELRDKMLTVFAMLINSNTLDGGLLGQVIARRNHALVITDSHLSHTNSASNPHRVEGPPGAVFAYTADDFEPLLQLTEFLVAPSKTTTKRTVKFAEALYHCLHSTFRSPEYTEQIVRSLLKSCNIPLATPGQGKSKKESKGHGQWDTSAACLARVLTSFRYVYGEIGPIMEVEPLQMALMFLLELLDAYVREVQNARSRLQDLEAQSEKVQKDLLTKLEKSGLEVGALESKVKRMESDALTTRLTYQTELQDVKSSLKKAQDEKALLESQLENARQQVAAERLKTSDANSSIKELRNKASELDQQVSRARTAKAKGDADLKTARQQAQSLKAEKAAVENLLAKAKEERKTALADALAKEDTIARLTKEAEKWKKECEDERRERQMMGAELVEKDGSVQQLTSEVEELKSRLAHAEAELRDAFAAREAVPDEDERGHDDGISIGQECGKNSSGPEEEQQPGCHVQSPASSASISYQPSALVDFPWWKNVIESGPSWRTSGTQEAPPAQDIHRHASGAIGSGVSNPSMGQLSRSRSLVHLHGGINSEHEKHTAGPTSGAPWDKNLGGLGISSFTGETDEALAQAQAENIGNIVRLVTTVEDDPLPKPAADAANLQLGKPQTPALSPIQLRPRPPGSSNLQPAAIPFAPANHTPQSGLGGGARPTMPLFDTSRAAINSSHGLSMLSEQGAAEPSQPLSAKSHSSIMANGGVMPGGRVSGGSRFTARDDSMAMQEFGPVRGRLTRGVPPVSYPLEYSSVGGQHPMYGGQNLYNLYGNGLGQGGGRPAPGPNSGGRQQLSTPSAPPPPNSGVRQQHSVPPVPPPPGFVPNPNPHIRGPMSRRRPP